MRGWGRVIVLWGATGYTGRRVAEAMVRRGLRPVLAGRNLERLGPLSGRLGQLDVVRAEASDMAPVRALMSSGDVLVSTVGPFLRLGEAALRAAVEAGAIYLDSTGEPPFIRRVFEEFGPRAQRSGASLITAFGYDYVPGNLAGALALRQAGSEVHRIEVGYLTGGVGRAQAISRGTFASMIGLITEQGFAWRGGIRGEPTGSRPRRITVGGRDHPALPVGATEHFALPRLPGAEGLREVDVTVGWSGSTRRGSALATRVVPALLALPGARPVLRRIGESALRWVAEEPDPAAVAGITSQVVATAFDAAGAALAQVHLESGDPYQLTADLLAWGAQRADDRGVSGPGALGPVEAFGLDTLAAGAAESGLRRSD